jgi:tRNA(Phe) wybutosine-synthesizing methylase Tyw3
MVQDAFQQRKAQVLSSLYDPGSDRSRKGSVDAPIVDLVDAINRLPGVYTTSSCSGRTSVFAEPTHESRAAGKKGGEWVYASHNPPAYEDVHAAVHARKVSGERGGVPLPGQGASTYPATWLLPAARSPPGVQPPARHQRRRPLRPPAPLQAPSWCCASSRSSCTWSAPAWALRSGCCRWRGWRATARAAPPWVSCARLLGRPCRPAAEHRGRCWRGPGACRGRLSGAPPVPPAAGTGSRVMVGVRCAIRLEAPLADGGELLVPDAYLRYLVAE